MKSVIDNPDGRYILIDAMIQDSPFLLLNIYAPDDTSEQCTFNFYSSSKLITGDFNVHLNAELKRKIPWELWRN